MSRAATKEVFTFDELNEQARERARDWYREGALDYDWWDCTYEDASQCGKILGIDLNQKPVKLMSGKTRYDPAIYFSGFSSQGDGACFEASYAYVKGSAKEIRQHAPEDKELHRIVDGLQAVQRRYFYRVEARTCQRGHYYHSGCMDVDAWINGGDLSADDESEVCQLLRDFADWIYRQLEQEYEWQMADEQVDESIRANEFTEDGSRYRY